MTKVEALRLLCQYCFVLSTKETLGDVVRDAAGMCERFPLDGGDITKAMRWLGYIQGVCVCAGVYSLAQVKMHSKRKYVYQSMLDLYKGELRSLEKETEKPENLNGGGRHGVTVIRKDEPTKEDPINPKHYSDLSYPLQDYQVIDILDSFSNTHRDARPASVTANLRHCLKYIFRFSLKGTELVNLKKARWYVDRAIQIAEREKELNDNARIF